MGNFPDLGIGLFVDCEGYREKAKLCGLGHAFLTCSRRICFLIGASG
jgi:hypothetical protein